MDDRISVDLGRQVQHHVGARTALHLQGGGHGETVRPAELHLVLAGCQLERAEHVTDPGSLRDGAAVDRDVDLRTWHGLDDGHLGLSRGGLPRGTQGNHQHDQ